MALFDRLVTIISDLTHLPTIFNIKDCIYFKTWTSVSSILKSVILRVDAGHTGQLKVLTTVGLARLFQSENQ